MSTTEYSSARLARIAAKVLRLGRATDEEAVALAASVLRQARAKKKPVKNAAKADG